MMSGGWWVVGGGGGTLSNANAENKSEGKEGTGHCGQGEHTGGYGEIGRGRKWRKGKILAKVVFF